MATHSDTVSHPVEELVPKKDEVSSKGDLRVTAESDSTSHECKILVGHPSLDLSFPERNKICLVMIVRDGAGHVKTEKDNAHLPVIIRALTSVVNLIDSYCICDTGSLDETPQLIEEFMLEHDKPGYVLFKEWKNFGENKTYLLQQAYGKNFSQGARYLMWLDTDETFLPRRAADAYEKTNDPKALLTYATLEDREKLLTFADHSLEEANNGIIMLQTFNGFSQRYQRWQMARNNQQYTWELPAHEVFEPPEGATTGQAYYEGIINLARKEGDGPKEGVSRNTTYIRWFKEWEATHEKTNRYYARNLFYLAQALEESGNLPEGIRYYKERLNYEGSYQEKYIARLRLSRIYKNVQALDEAIKHAEEAEKMVPNRLEAYLEHMYCLDTQKKFKEAYLVGIRGLQHGRLNPTDLFVEYDVYDWKFMLHIMLMAHYSNNDVGAYNLAKKFMEEKKYPAWFASQAESNFKIIEGKYLSSLAVVSEPKGVTEDRFSGFSPVVDDSPIKLPTNRLPALMIIDNFFEDPDAVRKLALSSEFNVKGNYPGGRTKSFATAGHKAAFERILGRKITYWPGDYNGSFQYAYGAHKSWIHRDSTDCSMVIFLSPNAPIDSGTFLYRHKLTGATFETPENKDILNNDSNAHDRWEIADKVGNKYNRAVIFNGFQSHQSGDYFGDNINNCRLFMLFFFNVEK